MTSILQARPGAVKIGPVGLPAEDRTLAPEILDWVYTYLLQPDGPDSGDPWRYTGEQAQFLAWWYAIDETGRFVYRRGLLRRMKGWGKDPMLATICAIELEGPCRFAGWGPSGFPQAAPHPAPWIQIAAVSKEQTKNTMTLFPGMFSPAAVAEFGLDIGKEILHSRRGGRIEAVTSSPATLEGGRPSLVVKNENQHWNSSNDGHEMSRVIDRNLAKSRDGSARAIAITNAHEPGRDSDAERDYDSWLAMSGGQSRGRGFLYDSLEAPPDTDLADPESLRAGLVAARGESYWLDVDRLVEEIYDPKTPPDMSRRFYLNQLWAAQDAWVAPVEWDILTEAEREVPEGTEITLGFDGSKTDDHCALVACVVEDSHLWPLGIWDPQMYGGEAPREEIDEMVRSAFDLYDVVGFFSDLHPWESYVDAWRDDLGGGLCVKATTRHSVAWDMRGRPREITSGVERFHDAILEGALSHSGDLTFSAHIYNARRRPNAYGVSIGKEHRESARKIDAVSAAILARMARTEYLALPDSRKRRKAKTGKAAFL